MREVAFLGALVCVLVVAAADARADDTAAAEALFKSGVAAFKSGDYAQACPALAESYKLDPRPGSLFTLAACEAKAGRVATASARYEDYLRLVERLTPPQQAQQKERVEIATREKAALEPQIPMLTLILPSNAPADTTVKRDDNQLGRPALGVALPVDPGEHVVSTQVPGGPVREQRIQLALGQRLTVNLVVTPPQAAPSAPAPVEAPMPPSASADEPAERPSGARRGLAYGALALGVAGLGVGAFTGVLALKKKGVVDDNCTGVDCNHAGKEAADSGTTLAHASTIGFAVGGAGVLGGVLLIVTERKAKPASTSGRGTHRDGQWRGTVNVVGGGAAAELAHAW